MVGDRLVRVCVFDVAGVDVDAGGVEAGYGVQQPVLGLGGGIVVTPVLTILLGINIRYAIGASLVARITRAFGMKM